VWEHALYKLSAETIVSFLQFSAETMVNDFGKLCADLKTCSLQAADSRSVFGKIFSALDLLVDLTVRLCAATFEVKSFTKSWLTAGFMIAYVYIAGFVLIFVAKAAIGAAVELVARSNAFGLRSAIARERGIEAYRAWLPLERIKPAEQILEEANMVGGHHSLLNKSPSSTTNTEARN
jgi:hypothetical protein